MLGFCSISSEPISSVPNNVSTRHGSSVYGPNRLLSYIILDEVRQAEIARRSRESLVNRLAVQKLHHLADLAHERQMTAQIAYTILFAEV